jgi:hypothetical protein
VTEAGRPPEPPPLMAPPGRDAEQDGLIEDTAPPSGLMSAPPRSASSRPGTEGPKGNGKKKPDLTPESSVQPSAPSAEADVPFPADGIHAPSGDGDRGGERVSVTGAALSGKLDSGRQAVRQVVAATNNWIASRAAKSDSSAPAKDNTDGPGASGAEASGAGASFGVVPETEAVADLSSEPATVVSPAAQPSVAARPSAMAQQSSYPPSRSPAMAQQPSYPPPQSSAAWSSTPAAPPAAVTVPVPNPRPSAKLRREAARRSRRQAHLTVARVEPWSVMKFSFVVSVVAFVILFVAIAVLYMVLSGLGVFTSLQHTVSTITSSQGSSGTNLSKWFSASRILGYTGMLGALNIVLITAMSTIGAVIYNLIAHTIGGVEVTLRETE